MGKSPDTSVIDHDQEQRLLLLDRIADRRNDLDELRAFLMQHPEIETPTWTGGERFLVYVFGADDGVIETMARYARLLSPCEKSDDAGYFNLVKRFGEVELHVYTMREKVCERRVVGTREVERPVMEQVGTETVTEEVVEWECRPLLLTDAERREGKAGVEKARESMREADRRDAAEFAMTEALTDLADRGEIL